MAKWWSDSSKGTCLDTGGKQPAWLELEPGEQYLGSFARWKRRATVMGAILGPSMVGPAVVFSANDNEWMAVALALGGVMIALIPLVSTRTERVHVTSLALVYRERGQYRVIPHSDITGITFGGSREKNQVFVQTTQDKQPVALMDSMKPQQTAEELAGLIGQYNESIPGIEGETK